MKASIFQPVPYTPSDPVRPQWPMAGADYDVEVGQRSFRQAIEQAVLAEELGFDWVSVAEHHYGALFSLTPNPTVFAGALSQRVRRCQIALLGATLPLTNPVRVAEEYAILDTLTEGRLIAGFLRGTPNEFLTYGTNPEESREQYWEGTELVLKAWTEPQPFGWQGRHYQYRTISVWPRPVQQPHPPVFLSGNSVESGGWAGRHRIGMAISFATNAASAQLVAHYRRQAAQVGWEPAADDILYRGNICLAETDAEALEAAQAVFGGGRPDGGPDGGRPAQPAGTGTGSVNPATTPAGMTMTQHALEYSRHLGSRDGVRALGVQFCGSPATVVDQLRRLRDEVGVGVVDFVFQRAAVSHERVLRSLELFGRQVLPRLREL
jgi:alkanesulfonate monooxygenase SsuD/methylene tetrahydromethanopterin reductase-like flavin-dependent oxidoreductase (luciferase family)